MDELIACLQNAPLLLQYFIPGLWTLLVFKFFCSKEIESTITMIMSCVISYVLISITEFILSIKCFAGVTNNIWIKSGITILVGTILAIVIAAIFSATWFSKLTTKFFHKTVNDDIWRDVLDLKNGSNLKLFIKECDYYVIGHHKNHEEKGEESWLAVSAFKKIKKNNDKVVEDHDADEKAIFTVRFSDLEHIEIFN